jgi:hypothetical protein
LLLTDESQPSNQAWRDYNLSLVSQEMGSTMTFESGGFALTPTPAEEGPTNYTWRFVSSQDDPGSVELLPMPAPPLSVFRPCNVLVEVELNGERYRRGEFTCGFMPPPPLTDEERRAIASRPGAATSVVYDFECNTCRSKAQYYSQLNPLDMRPADLPTSAVPLHAAPSAWLCACGQSSVDLSYLKQGLHDVFRHIRPGTSGTPLMHYTPLYEAGRIQDIVAEYEQLIESVTEEEAVQKYLEDQPVLWAFLSPAKILHKPAVLTKKKADFGILTSHKILYLVEIEKPITGLINRDGSISAEIQKGANQIRDWQGVITDHRLALLSELGLTAGEVQGIRYLLIGGLARRTSATGLTKLRRTPFAPNTDFYCFDELASFLHTLAAELRWL